MSTATDHGAPRAFAGSRNVSGSHHPLTIPRKDVSDDSSSVAAPPSATVTARAELVLQSAAVMGSPAVDVHLLRPVAQRVHDQLERLGAVRVQRVAAARVVDVEAPIILQAVVGGVVEPAQTQGGTVVAALGGVVKDDVEDDLAPGGVQRLDHRLELDDLSAVRAPQCVLMVRGEEADRLIAPVVAQPASDQPGVMDELLHGKQLHRRDAEPQEMVDGDRMPQAGVSAAQRADVGMPFRKALDVELVNDRVRQRDARRPVAAQSNPVAHTTERGT